MIEYFSLLAEYNRKANEAMYAILSSLSDEQRSAEIGSYYRSIAGTVRHILSSDLIWLTRISAAFPALAAVRFNSDELSPAENIGFSALRDRRARVDAVFEGLAREVTEDLVQRDLVYIDKRGNERRYIFWQALLHMFNHQTHHRGAVSEALDRLKVENDYSNIIWYISPPK